MAYAYAIANRIDNANRVGHYGVRRNTAPRGTTVNAAATTTQKPIIGHCLRCRRALRVPTADGYGPKCRVMIRKARKAQVVSQYKAHLVAKAEELIEQGALIPLRGRHVFQVIASNGTDTYKTAPQGCTCAAGLKGKHVCYHRIAAHILSLAA
jgi:hypothetical protein